MAEREWCLKKPKHIKGLGWSEGRPVSAPVRITCPNCKQRFKPRIRSCGDCNGKKECWHMYLPAHRVKQ